MQRLLVLPFTVAGILVDLFERIAVQLLFTPLAPQSGEVDLFP